MLEAVSKPHLRPDSCVSARFKMLTYARVCCAFSSGCALLSGLIRGFETTSSMKNLELDRNDTRYKCRQEMSLKSKPDFKLNFMKIYN